MSRNLHQDDRAFALRAKRVLDGTVQEMDQPIALRLQRGRLAALESKPRRSVWSVWASGFAVVSVAALALYLWGPQPISQQHEIGRAHV